MFDSLKSPFVLLGKSVCIHCLSRLCLPEQDGCCDDCLSLWGYDYNLDGRERYYGEDAERDIDAAREQELREDDDLRLPYWYTGVWECECPDCGSTYTSNCKECPTCATAQDDATEEWAGFPWDNDPPGRYDPQTDLDF